MATPAKAALCWPWSRHKQVESFAIPTQSQLSREGPAILPRRLRAVALLYVHPRDLQFPRKERGNPLADPPYVVRAAADMHIVQVICKTSALAPARGGVEVRPLIGRIYPDGPKATFINR